MILVGRQASSSASVGEVRARPRGWACVPLSALPRPPGICTLRDNMPVSKLACFQACFWRQTSVLVMSRALSAWSTGPSAASWSSPDMPLCFLTKIMLGALNKTTDMLRVCRDRLPRRQDTAAPHLQATPSVDAVYKPAAGGGGGGRVASIADIKLQMQPHNEQLQPDCPDF